MLFEIVRKLPDGAQINMSHEASTNELSIHAGRSVFDLPCLASEEFPSVETADLNVRFSIAAPELARLIDKTRFAMSTEETRYYLNGVHLHVHKDGAASTMRAVATDGHRLARIEVGLPDGAADMPPIIVPRKTVQEMRKLLGDETGEVAVSVSPQRILMVMERATLTSRLIDGTFPDYERVIPKDNDRSARLKAAELAAAVDRVATVALEKARTVKMAFSEGKAAISAIGGDTARAFEEIECNYDGEPMEIGFNGRYVLDMLECIDGDEVTIEFSGPAAPSVARDPKNAAAVFVLMPMRV
jgi:DNA polymerase-3 subunit beta